MAEALEQFINLPARDVLPPRLRPRRCCRVSERSLEGAACFGETTEPLLRVRKMIGIVDESVRQAHVGQVLGRSRNRCRTAKGPPNQVECGPSARLDRVQGIQISRYLGTIFVKRTTGSWRSRHRGHLQTFV